MGLLFSSTALGFTVNLNVQGMPKKLADGTQPANVAIGNYRWLIEEDTTHPVTPGVSDPNSLAFSFHKSHAPVVVKGDQTNAANITLPNGKRYYVSILPNEGYTIGGAQIADGQAAATVICNQLPLPTAQITVFVFHDNSPINNAPDPAEPGLAGFKVIVTEAGGRYGVSGGQAMMDAFGNMIGTTYRKTGDVFDEDADGNPVVDTPGQGFVLTDASGYATIKFLSPGKYGLLIAPPAGQQGWQQTSTIEGTKTIDAWVKADEPPFFTEFGPAGQHVFVGFVQHMNTIPAGGGSTISGQVVNLHMSRPPAVAFFPGEPHANAWVGLNVGQAGTGPGIYAAPCDPDTGEFTIPNVPPGTYQLVFWDRYLDNIFAFLGLTVPAGGGAIDLGEVGVFRWFGKMENTVFYDANENGFRDPDEMYVFPEQAINLRFRDGSLYQTLPTDNSGSAPLEEVFPFFNWLVAEVDFLRFKATGMTVTVDGGGGPLTPGSNINPQIQADGKTYRTETGPVLTQGMQLFIGQTNAFEWGKKEYAPTENGGISGIVYYANTRAENDPRYAVGDPWEPGIPRVQVNLYADGGTAGSALTPMPDGVIDDLDGDGQVTLADVDNYPFNWRSDFQFLADGVTLNPVWTGTPGTEDLDRNGNGVFDAGDAIAIATTDSWDDNQPTDCPGDPADPFYQGGKCYDGLRNFNQVRPAVFDGGYAFGAYVPGGVDTGAAEVTLPAGTYIVEATRPPGYELVKEQDRNVDFGDSYTPSLLLLPPVCVGEPHTVPAQLALFAGTPAPYAGESRPLCDRKQVALNNGQNTAADFFLFTEVPKAGRFVGFILNDLANEFNPNSPSFGEKYAPPWLPVSIRDYRGTEISRVYSDEYGAYNALVPSTFTANRPIPSGFAPNMLTVVINDPFLANGNSDPQYNSLYSTFQYTFQYMPGVTTYLDTPVLPIAAFASPNTFPLDVEFPDGTPVVSRVDGAANGPYVASVGDNITITSLGTAVQVRNPDYGQAGQPQFIPRDYGFGAAQGGGSVTIGGNLATVVSWNATTIVVNAPNSGQLVVTRDNGGVAGKSSVVGIYVTVGGSAPIRVTPGAGAIQAAIDNAGTLDGSLILIEPGTYSELVILHKNVRLQGTGAGVTNISAFKIPADKLQTWRTDIATRLAGQFDLLPGQTLGVDTFKNEFGPGIIVLGENDGSFNAARIDGFTITGADQGGAILVNGYTNNLLISNNRIRGNQGFYGGGIRVGHPELIFQAAGGEQVHVDAQNDAVTIQHNHIAQNGGLNGAGGGVSIHTGADGYVVRRNFIAGNFTSGSGAGIGHLGASNGTISENTITFNQSFNQGLTVVGGGVLVSGLPTVDANTLPVGPGSGAVLIDNNRIQGNQAGAGDGGGIALRSTNSDLITITDNVVVNNVTGLAGGGISMQDAANVNISNNTIARNDSTATASLAFTNGLALPSENQPAGIASRAHTPALNTFLATVNGYSNPAPFAGNILWQNRTFYWDGSLVPPALVPDVSTAPAVYWDLGVLGAAGQMSPVNGTLTSLGPSALDPAVYAGSNVTADPGLAGAYFNGARGIPVVNEVTVIQTAIAADEGGNAIDVAFGPLTYAGAYTDTVLWGPNGGIGVLAQNPGGSGGGSGGGWGCFIAAASEEASARNNAWGLAVIGMGLLAVVAILRRRLGRDSLVLMLVLASALVSGLVVSRAGAEVSVQCPADTDGVDTDGDGIVDNDIVCKHLAAGDGFINMADGKLQYIFGFSDVTAMMPADVMSMAMFGANFPAPTIKVKEGQKLYLTLTNVGMMARPDLFDPHTVHYHGFPNASAVFDGVPDASISINMGSSLTYFYYNAEPGTFIYHCHVEAAEHMQMGMLGQIYVTPKQDGTAFPDPDGSGRTYTKFAYNDGDGSTGYDVDFPIQIASFDPAFHDASLAVQPLPFALMQDKYPMLNGRGYPDTVNPNPLPNTADMEGYMMMDPLTRKLNSLITCTQGQKVLLRVSSLSTTSFHTLSALGIPMKVVGKGARILRGPSGKNLFYNTSSVDLGGGEAADVILDTKDVAPGTYFLYVTNLNHLSNDGEDYGGMMTEIVVSAP
jgi:FtsP/CotA-like multicopper oxidase with cupredoxin domain